MDNGELIPHLFRTEYTKIIAVLCKRFGFGHIEDAEDIASDTFLTAVQTWPRDGIPPNPTAWLYTVAKNKAVNYLHRHSTFRDTIIPAVQHASPGIQEQEIDLSSRNIKDSQLQMMFALCYPSIPAEAQIGLSLRFLCGFGVEEIADAFLTNKATINKRLYRAKKKLREEQIAIKLPGPSEMERRLDNVLTTIYLLFNEGYYSVSHDSPLRKDLCLEAMRLCHMLIEYEPTDQPQVNALLSLMCFHASRFEARVDKNGELILYQDQDPDRWDTKLIQKGAYYLHRSTSGTTISKYHLEAAIAWWHTQKTEGEEKWKSILQLYDYLLQIEYSPIAALNRTFALSKVAGKQKAIAEAEKLDLHHNHFYYALLGELYTEINTEKALQSFQRALSLARTQADKRTIQKKIDRLS